MIVSGIMVNVDLMIYVQNITDLTMIVQNIQSVKTNNQTNVYHIVNQQR